MQNIPFIFMGEFFFFSFLKQKGKPQGQIQCHEGCPRSSQWEGIKKRKKNKRIVHISSEFVDVPEQIASDFIA
jgi:hypothetical protein